jgi:glycosyltransferase involved in cell wall biosynthesis
VRGSDGDAGIWIVDPIDYSGMAYYDEGLAAGLSGAGARVVVAGSDSRRLPVPPDAARETRAIFRRTSGSANRVVRGLNYGASVARLVWTIRGARVRAVIWQYSELAAVDYLAMRILRALKVKVLFVAHEIEPWEASGVSRRLRAAIVRHAWRLIAHGEPEAVELRRRYGLASGRVVVTGHGDFRRFQDPSLTQAEARRRTGLPLEVPIALFFGSGRPSKGLSVLFEAWESVHARLPQAMLVVAGRPARGAEGAPPVPGVIRREGMVDPPLAVAFYAAADLVVIPYERITTSGVMRHAFSSGRALVATSVGELNRHVVPDQTGWLVPVGDADALASALADALGDRSRLQRMGESARAYALRAWDWDEIGRQTLAIIEG